MPDTEKMPTLEEAQREWRVRIYGDLSEASRELAREEERWSTDEAGRPRVTIGGGQAITIEFYRSVREQPGQIMGRRVK